MMMLFVAVFHDAAVFGDTNLELPSFLSIRSVVEIHLDFDPSIFSKSADINLELPLHARYQVSIVLYGFKPAINSSLIHANDYFSQLPNQLQVVGILHSSFS